MRPETWWQFEIYCREPAVCVKVCYFQNELTGKRWSKKFGARFTRCRAVEVLTSDGRTGTLDGKEISLRCIRPETSRR